MEYTASPMENKIVLSGGAVEDTCDCEEDSCSVCLEPFTGEDPATVTSCKHEYHLQCILDWSQRSKECPICWQLLILKDPASQELLAAVEIERNSRSRRTSSNTSDVGFDHVSSYSDESGFDERIMQHLAAAMGRVHHFSRRERHRSSGLGPSQFLVFASPETGSDIQQTNVALPIESQTSDSVLSPNSSPTVVSTPVNNQSPSSVLSSYHVNMASNMADSSHGPSMPRVLPSQVPPDSPQGSRPSELLSFSESLKSRWSAASARYKESISKSTRGFKEKILARNSVKELSKEVQREVTAGVTRMMERLDPTSKRSAGSHPVSNNAEGTSGLSYNGKGVQENQSDQIRNENDGEAAYCSNSDTTLPVRLGVSHVQDTL